jgi:hypothetical protein
MKWLGDSQDMDHSEELQDVKLDWLTHEKAWEGSNNIEEEVAEEVVVGDEIQSWFGSTSLEEVQDDLNQEHNVESKFNLVQGVILLGLESFRLTFLRPRLDHCVSTLLFFTPLVHIHKDKYIRGDKKVIDQEKSDHHVPDLAECSITVNQVPLKLLLWFSSGSLILSFLIDVVDHHFLEVRFRHLLETSLESQLVVIPSGFVPELIDVSFFLIFGHVLKLTLVFFLATFRLALLDTTAKSIEESSLTVIVILLLLVIETTLVQSGGFSHILHLDSRHVIISCNTSLGKAHSFVVFFIPFVVKVGTNSRCLYFCIEPHYFIFNFKN